MNLGRLYAQKGMVMKAIAEFEAALGMPSARVATRTRRVDQRELRKLRAMLN